MPKTKYSHENTALHYGFSVLDIEDKKISDDVEKTKLTIFKEVYKKYLEGRRKVGAKFKIATSLKSSNKKISLNVINLDNPIAEAVILKTALDILKDEGYIDFVIEINSLGDKESGKIFKKKLTEYYREKKDLLKNFEKKKISSDPVSIYFSTKEYLKEVNQEAPNPIDNLSEEGYDFFRNLTEHIDSFGVEYKINPHLFSEKRHFRKSIFKIYAKKNKKSELIELAVGGRYDEIAAETVKKKKVFAVGLFMSFNHALKKHSSKRKKGQKDVKISLLKIGSNAELKFLKIVEIFKKIDFPVNFSLEERKLSRQFQMLKDDEVEKFIIFGVKEAKDDKVIVRDAKTMSQTRIPISSLEKYMNKILK